MALTEYVMMPGKDYQAACDMLRSKTGKTDLIKSGDLEAEIEGLFAGEIVEKSVEADFSTGDMDVTCGDGEYMSKVTVVKPETLVPGNVAYGVRIAGVEGNYMGSVSSDEDMFALYTAGASVLENGNVTSVVSNIFSGQTRITSVNFPACSTIGSRAFFACTNLKTAILPNCTSIGSGAFASCSQLYSVSVPACTSLGASAFSNCVSLTTIRMPVLSIVPSFAFYTCNGLMSAEFSVASRVSNSAFYGCANLSRIDIPGCTAIGANAFAQCHMLSEVNAPNCTTIGSSAFKQCVSLTRFVASKCVNIDQSAFCGAGTLSYVSFVSCSAVGQKAFYDCQQLSYAHVSGLSFFGESVFANCTNLQTIALYGETSSSLSIYQGTFAGTADGKSLDIYVRAHLYSYCFSGCLASRVVLKHFTGTQYPGMFAYCSKLQDANLSTTTAWTSIFVGCSSLRRAVVGNKIAVNAFYGCSALEMIKMNYCSFISSGAFYGCSNLSILYLEKFSSMTMYSSPLQSTPLHDSSFLGYYGSVYVPESLVTTFQADSGWASYASRITAVTDEIKALFDGELT